MKWLILIAALWCLVACHPDGKEEWPLLKSPAGPDSETPRFHKGPEGSLYLSWTEWTGDTMASLCMSRLASGTWSPKTVIARGSDWFVNWADTPGLTAFADGKHLAAHWLQKSAPGKYDYDVMISISPDGGLNWGTPFPLHDDSVAAEHGFVSATRSGDHLFYAWLDGRRTVKDAGAQGSHGHDHPGAMTLRGTWLDTGGNKHGESELDSMVCDCCQTDVISGPEGILVSYRDRSAQEVRDIAHVRWNAQGWSGPTIVFPDEWRISGCPVNGPAMATNGQLLCRAWFGTHDSTGHVSAILSRDGGFSWDEPVRLDGDSPPGRVDITAARDGFLVSWIGRDRRDSTGLMATWLMPGEQPGEPMLVARMDPGRASGFPVIGTDQDGWYAAYTSTGGTGSQVVVRHKSQR